MTLDLTLMSARLKASLENASVRQSVLHNLFDLFTYVDSHLGLHDAETHADFVIGKVRGSTNIRETEIEIFTRLQELGIIDKIAAKQDERARTIFGQIRPFLTRDADILDFGSGSGRVTKLIHANVSRATYGIDVCRYPYEGGGPQLIVYDGRSIPFPPNSFDIIVSSAVLHHDRENELLLPEFNRVLRVGGRAVIIETIPMDDSAEELARTFVIDWFYNRCILLAGVPVPGAYRTQRGWIDLFRRHGFRLATIDGIRNPQHLGIDQQLVPDYHILMVFEKE
ncbi:MAG TPA: class I SAM-dependent methyltransferase [Candidatus Paceibacterota bacterium]